jgi:hypothetical protein
LVEGPLVAAVQVLAVAHAKLVAEVLVEAHRVVVKVVAAAGAALVAVDDVGGDAVPRQGPRGHVGGGGPPLARHHVVARRLGGLRRHPEPDGRLEGDEGVVGHQLRVVQQVQAPHVLPGLAVVVVPGELHGTPAVVLLAGCAGPPVAGLAVVVAGAQILRQLLEAVAPGVGAAVRVRAPARGQVRRLRARNATSSRFRVSASPVVPKPGKALAAAMKASYV